MFFADVLLKLKDLLEENETINNYARDHWDCAFTVDIKPTPQQQKRIPDSDLPLILITRPAVSRTELSSATDANHIVGLYIGFYQACEGDGDGVIEQIEIEEVIEGVLHGDPTLGGLCIDVTVGDSANDAGSHHPAYFTAMVLTIRYREVR